MGNCFVHLKCSEILELTMMTVAVIKYMKSKLRKKTVAKIMLRASGSSDKLRHTTKLHCNEDHFGEINFLS